MQTTQDLIKILPFDDDFKKKLLADYNDYSPDQKFAIERVVWDLYDAMYDLRLTENMQKAFERAKKNEENLDEDFYKRIAEETDRQMAEESSEVEQTVELSTAREELQKLMETKKQPN